MKLCWQKYKFQPFKKEVLLFGSLNKGFHFQPYCGKSANFVLNN